MKTIKMLKAVLMAVMVVSLVMFSSASIYAAGKKADKIEMCHEGKVILVSGNAVKAHLGHGDPDVFIKEGDTCQEYTAEETEPTPEPEAPSFNFSF